MKLYIFVLILCFPEFSRARCVDGENNVIRGVDVGSDNIIKLLNFSIYLYDQNNQPACYKNIGDIKFPGILKIKSATFNITKQLNATGIPKKTRLLFTVKKNDFLVGYICKDGKSGNVIVEDRDCNLDFCEKHEGLCRLMEIPGVHKLDEILKYANSSDTIVLDPPQHGFTDAILRGQWKGGAEITIGDKSVAHIKFPSESTWNWINE